MMPVSFEIHTDQGFFVSTWGGEIMDSDLQSSYETLFRDKAFKPGLNEIADMSDADMKGVTSNGLQTLSWMVRQRLGDKCAGFKTAIIAPEDLSFGLSRMYEMLSDDSPESVKVFRERDEAWAWINEE